MRIRDHLELPESTSLDTFIVKLDDAEDRVRQNLRLFVVGESVKPRMDAMLGDVGARLDDGRDVGRFVYGSFGSGKSHLLTVLGRMLERDELAYDVGHSYLRELRERHGWLDRHRTLVVRLNMMGKRNLASALYEAFNAALPEEAPRLEFTDEEKVFRMIEGDAERLGGLDALLQRAADDGAIPRPDFYHRMREGNLDQRLSLAAKMLTWRNHGEELTRPDDLWLPAAAGFDRIARHAKELGYTAVAWMIDELVIWIREKDRATYIKQVNDLSSLVDHDAARVLPFFAAVAVQMDIAETCPEDISERGFREQLGFVSNRFQPALHLEDQDLYEVCSQRVLARRRDLSGDQRQAFEDAIDGAFSRNRDAVRSLSGDLDPELVRQLYPFQPALLRVLVDVTQALSRNRTAVAALYGLLDRYRELQVGDFVPLGALWEILFTADNVQTLKQNARSALAQRLADTAETWRRLEGKVEAISTDEKVEPTELVQLVRSTLLCQLSERPYFPDGRSLRERVTASTLLRLNQTDVRAMTERTGISKVARLFRKLGGVAPQVQVVGETADPTIHVKTESVDIERVLARARSEVQHQHRFAYIRRLLIEQLGLDLGTGNEGPLSVLWKGARRKGRARLANTRTLSYAGQNNEFDPGKDAFLVLVDYPFDEDPSKGRQDDIDTITRARARQRQWTLAWLPSHLSSAEVQALNNAAAVELIRKDRRGYLEEFSPRDAEEIARALESYQAGRRGELEEAVRERYFVEGQVHTLSATLGDVSVEGLDRGRALESLAAHILTRRYPRHPDFRRRVGISELTQVADWVVRAAKTGQPVDLRSAEMGLVEAVAVPLELVYPGPSSITARKDGRYLRAVLERVGEQRVVDAAEMRDWLMSGEGFGLTKEVANLFLYYLLQVEGFEAQVGGQGKTVHGLSHIQERFSLVKDEVVDAPTWDRAIAVADRLLQVKGRADLPTSPEQSKLSRDAVAATRELRGRLSTYLLQLRGICGWAGVAEGDSGRYREAGELASFLDGILGQQGNAARARRMAELATDQRLATWEVLRRSLEDETAALGTVTAQKLAFEQLADSGGEEAQTVVVERLSNLLGDGSESGPLGPRAREWAVEAEKQFRRWLDERKVGTPLQPDPEPGPPEPGPPAPTEPTGPGESTGEWPARTHVRVERIARANLGDVVQRSLDELLEGAEGSVFTVQIDLERIE